MSLDKNEYKKDTDVEDAPGSSEDESPFNSYKAFDFNADRIADKILQSCQLGDCAKNIASNTKDTSSAILPRLDIFDSAASLNKTKNGNNFETPELPKGFPIADTAVPIAKIGSDKLPQQKGIEKEIKNTPGNTDTPGSAEALARGQEETAASWNTRGYGSEAITARLVKNGIRAAGAQNQDISRFADDSDNRRKFKEFGSNSSDFLRTFKSDSRFETVQNGQFKESDLKRGDILVWPRDSRHPYGLSKVYLGDGKNASDHVSSLKDDLKNMGNSTPVVFRLKETEPGSNSPVLPEKDKPSPAQPQPDKREEKPVLPESNSDKVEPVMKNSTQLSHDPRSADFFKFREPDGSISDLKTSDKDYSYTDKHGHKQKYLDPNNGYRSFDSLAPLLKPQFGKGEKWTSSMERRFNEIVNDPRMRFSMRIDGKEIAQSKNSEEMVQGASVSKAMVAAAAYNRYAEKGEKMPEELQKKINMLLTFSSNKVWDDVQQAAGGKDGVDAFTKKMGYEHTKAARQSNRLSPSDSAKFMEDVSNNRFAGAEKLFAVMSSCQTGSNKTRLTLPEDVAIAHKTGTYNGWNNDMAAFKIKDKEGKEHDVSFAAYTQLSPKDIGILAGGVLRQQGLLEKENIKDPNDRSSQHHNDRDVRARESAQVVAKVARELGVDPATAVSAMLVESGGNPRAVGDGGTSFGLFQLHKGGELDYNIYNRSLTKEEAFDPELNARVALSVFKQNQDRYRDPGTLAARSQRPADQEGYAQMVNANLSVAKKLIDSAATKPSNPEPEKKNSDDAKPEMLKPAPVPAEKSMLSPKLQKYFEQLGSMEKIESEYPFKMDLLKPNNQYDEMFLQGREDFQRRQTCGEAPSREQLFAQAKAAAVPGQRFFEASVPYWVSSDKQQAVGQNFLWDESGRLISENYWRRGGGDQLGRGKDVTIYHNIEGVNAGGSDVGWINQSTNESTIARGGNPSVDMHGRSMSSGTSAGCEAHPSDKNYQNWLNFRNKMHYAILDNQSRGLRPFASLHVGFEYAIDHARLKAGSKY